MNPLFLVTLLVASATAAPLSTVWDGRLMPNTNWVGVNGLAINDVRMLGLNGLTGMNGIVMNNDVRMLGLNGMTINGGLIGTSGLAYQTVAAPAVAVAEPVAVKQAMVYDFPEAVSALPVAPVTMMAEPVRTVVQAEPIVQHVVQEVVQPVVHTVVQEVVQPIVHKYVQPAPQTVMVSPEVVEERVVYENRAVVTGHTSTIMKPDLGLLATPDMDALVTQTMIQAPVRTHTVETPEITITHPTKVNVEKIPVEIPVSAPFADPYPVPITPQVEVHRQAPPTIQHVQSAPIIQHVQAEPIHQHVHTEQLVQPVMTGVRAIEVAAAPVMEVGVSPVIMNDARLIGQTGLVGLNGIAMNDARLMGHAGMVGVNGLAINGLNGALMKDARLVGLTGANGIAITDARQLSGLNLSGLTLNGMP